MSPTILFLFSLVCFCADSRKDTSLGLLGKAINQHGDRRNANLLERLLPNLKIIGKSAAQLEDNYASDNYASDNYASDNYASDNYASEKYPSEIKTKPPEELWSSGEACTWAKGAYKTFSGQTFYCTSESLVSFCRDCIQNGAEFNIEIKRNKKLDIEKIKANLDNYDVEFHGNNIFVNNTKITMPYINKMLRIQMCGMFQKVESRKGFLTLMILPKQSFSLSISKKYKTCGLCGTSKDIPAEILHQFITSNIIEDHRDVALHTRNPEKKGLNYCRTLISRYFDTDNKKGLLDKYSNICGYEYANCTHKDKRVCACPTFIEMARMSGNEGCSDNVKYWRRDKDIACGIPQCPEAQIYEECGTRSHPTCSNQNPFQEKGVVSSCICGEGRVIDDMSGSNACIHQSDCPCAYSNTLYKPGEKRKGTCDSECSCAGGKWICPENTCGGTCKIKEGIFVTNFDGNSFSLHGNCDYILAYDDNWIISAEISQTLNAQKASYLNGITLALKLGPEENKFIFKLDGSILHRSIKYQNYYKSDQLKISRMDNHVYVETKNSLKLLIETGKVMQVKISVPNRGFQNTKGICGSFDSNSENDYKTPQNIQEKSLEAFVQSWKASPCPDSSEVTCISLENELFAEEHCSKLQDPNGTFSRGHSAVDYRPFYERCVKSTCQSTDSKSSLCTALKNYVDECVENGIFLSNWRNKMCHRECKNNQVLQYRAASCYQTCASVPDAENCDDQTLLFEDCGCPDGQYLNTEQVCVHKLDCDCYTGYGVFAAHESKKIAGNTCICSEGKIKCADPEGERYEKCKGGAEFLDCSYPKSHRRDDLWCNTTHLPKLHKTDDCNPGCYCPISMVKNSKGECILPSECPCYFGGEEFENGRTVINSCNKCFCNKGVWKCTNKKCSSTCHIHGDGHFRTFDDMSFSFDGLCQYTVVEDYCNSDEGTFRILAQSVPCCDNELTCARKIIVIYKDLSITFQDGKANIENAEALDCSRKQSTVLYSINTVGLYKILKLPNGIHLFWDSVTRLSITLDPHWNGKVCGLCGNNNGNLKDELKTRAGSVVVETLAFANTWKVDPDCKNTEEQIFPCDANPHCKPWAERKCNILREGKFKECRHKVDPTLYYNACIEEACVCDMEGKYSGYCTTIAMYAEACNIAGVCVNWREPNLCREYSSACLLCGSKDVKTIQFI